MLILIAKRRAKFHRISCLLLLHLLHSNNSLQYVLCNRFVLILSLIALYTQYISLRPII